MNEAVSLSNRVKPLRQRLGLRQADLAREVGVTRQTVLAIEKGRLNPSIVIALRIARVLREPVDYVFYLAPGITEQSAEGATAPEKLTAEPAAVMAFPEEVGVEAETVGVRENAPGDEDGARAIFDFI